MASVTVNPIGVAARCLLAVVVCGVGVAEAQMRAPAPFSFPTKGQLGARYDEGIHKGVDIWTGSSTQPAPGYPVYLPYPGKFLDFFKNKNGSNIQGVRFYHEIDSRFPGLPSYRVITEYFHMANEATREVYANLSLVRDTWYFRGHFLGFQGNQRYQTGSDPYREDVITHLHFQMRDKDTNLVLDPSPYLGFALNATAQPLAKGFAFLSSYDPSASVVRWHPDGTVLKRGDQTAVYMIHEGKKKHITDQNFLTYRVYGPGWEDVITVTADELACYASGEPIDTGPRLIKGSSDSTYLVFNGRYKRLIAGDAFTGIGYAWPRIETVPDATLLAYPDDPVAPELLSPYWEGALIKGTGSGTVYVISNGTRRGFTTEAAFRDSGFIFARVMQEYQTVVDAMPRDADIDDAAIRRCGDSDTRVISVSGDLAFGDVQVGTTATRPMTISNIGTSVLTVSGISYPNGFSGAWSGSIGPGGSQLVSVTFAPTLATSYTGSITVNSDSTGGMNTINVSGRGVAGSNRPGPFGKINPPFGSMEQPTNTTLSWTASQGATAYEYCITISSPLQCDTGWIGVGSAMSVALPGLLYAWWHGWQVRAINAFGSTEADGDNWWAFATETPPQGTFFQDGAESGYPSVPPWAATTESAHSGRRSWTDSVGSPYGPNLNVSLWTPWFELTTATNPQLVFWHRHDLATDGDQANVWVTTDNGATFTLLASYTGKQSTWTEKTISLEAWAGAVPVVQVVFQLFSNASGAGDGWYIDDIVVKNAEPPDLIETSVLNPPTVALLGSAFSVTDTAENRGLGSAGASTTRYYLSPDKVRNSSDRLLTGSRLVPVLGPNGSSAGTVTVKVAPTTPLGTYFLLACADDLRKVVETNEVNNCLASTSTISVRAPDLIQTAMGNPPAAAARGLSFLISETVLNQGSAGAASTTTRFYLSVDALRNSGDKGLTGTRVVPSLGVGASSGGTVTVTVPSSMTLGTYFVLTCADDTKVAFESNETNNCRASTTSVQVTP
jgi:hypothetical protein